MAEFSPPSVVKGARGRFPTLAIVAFVAALVYCVDQGSKFLVVRDLPEGRPVPVLGELLQLTFVKNPGAAFSLGSGSTWIFTIVASAVAIFLVIYARRIHSRAWAVVFGLLLGGNIGNLSDRLLREPSFGQGHVVDFFQVFGFPAIFNVADIAIVSSMCLFVILTLRGVRLEGPAAVSSAEE